MRSGIQLWVEDERITTLKQVLQTIDGTKFIEIDEQVLNTADIVGVFTADTMSEHTRRKNGQWQCNQSHWHDRGEKCNCVSREKIEEQKRKAQEHYEEHGYYPLGR